MKRFFMIKRYGFNIRIIVQEDKRKIEAQIVDYPERIKDFLETRPSNPPYHSFRGIALMNPEDEWKTSVGIKIATYRAVSKLRLYVAQELQKLESATVIRILKFELATYDQIEPLVENLEEAGDTTGEIDAQ